MILRDGDVAVPRVPVPHYAWNLNNPKAFQRHFYARLQDREIWRLGVIEPTSEFVLGFDALLLGRKDHLDGAKLRGRGGLDGGVLLLHQLLVVLLELFQGSLEGFFGVGCCLGRFVDHLCVSMGHTHTRMNRVAVWLAGQTVRFKTCVRDCGTQCLLFLQHTSVLNCMWCVHRTVWQAKKGLLARQALLTATV